MDKASEQVVKIAQSLLTFAGILLVEEEINKGAQAYKSQAYKLCNFIWIFWIR